MTLGKAHLVGSLAMTALAVTYTVWSLSAPRRPATSTAPEIRVEGPAASGIGGPSAPVDPRLIPPAPEVALDRLPQSCTPRIRPARCRV